MEKIGLRNEAYKSIPISSIIISYGISCSFVVAASLRVKIIPTIGPTPNKDGQINYQIYYRNLLPIVTAPEEYGRLLQNIIIFI